ncbi:MAG: anti-sigma factor [SAR202 cluster bacterium]|nr:anti-sigma factor [SAR202 cluster bacterium]
MATNNQIDRPGDSVHPEDMLEAFALDALNMDEEELVIDHLDGCDQCSDVVHQYQAAVVLLAQSVPTEEPPSALRARLMQAVSRAEPKAPAPPKPQLVPSFGDRLADSRLIRVMIPVVASTAMVLVVMAVAMNVRISSQVGDLQQENATLRANLDANVATVTAQMNDAANVGSEVMDTVSSLQQASFEMAQPNNMSLELRSPFAESRSQGILLVSSDGNRGVIMVAGMDSPSLSTDYQVWLMRGEDKMWAGQVSVDSQGRGTVSLQLPEPIMHFEKVELTTSADPNASQAKTDMVLQGNLVSMNTPRLVSYAPWR